MLDIQTVHHILKNTAVQNVNKPFVYITDLTSTLTINTLFFILCYITLTYIHGAQIKSLNDSTLCL